MISLLVVGTMMLIAAIVIGVLAAVLGIVGFFVTLPFRILGLVFKLVGFLIALPFLLLGAVLGGGALLVGLALAVTPLLPAIALVALIWWLVRRGSGHDRRSQANVAS